MNAPEQLPLDLAPVLSTTITDLNRKAMLVRLTISRPATSKRDVAAESFTQQQLKDDGLRVSSTLFKDRTNPVRVLLNAVGGVYTYHKQNTLPYIDRGPRLLPVANYETYRDTMRKLVDKVQSFTKEVLPQYDACVQADMRQRGERAALSDYPTKEQFEDSLNMTFTFSPLPDEKHFLFDVSEEDKAALAEQMKDVIYLARQDMFDSISEPLAHMIDRLKAKSEDSSARFHDSVVENLIAAVSRVRKLSMGDESLLAICEEVDRAISGHARNPQVLKDSPVVRDAAAAKLKEVEDKMKFMFGG